MPIYQYRCLNCNLQFELKQSFNDKPIADCPSCHGIARRIFSSVPILFKGPGFYVTDSREEREKRADSEGLRQKEKDSGGSKS
ncbi:MAG: zinc ribbon domain-containing protein [Dehalococcoidia bacterium]|nr:zinc ribbon domain-containing protein [Dehalococcoidia bacterium]